jgi:peptidyl-prolyl cis-trans isomerase SDCCAG10
VAMVNNNKLNNNRSAFFITFDECPWLDKKHTIFGKVVGDTIFNLLKMQDIDTDANDKPIEDS